MINNNVEYMRACEELKFLHDWLERLTRENPGPGKGFTKAGVRKMIARIHEELGAYEGRQELELELESPT